MKLKITKKIPDFYIVGAAKSGTTSLWHHFGKHPQIFMTKDIAHKELGFFCNNHGLNSLEQYTLHFKNALDYQIIGEVCHSYLSSPESAGMIYKYNPNSKIIIILRNPVERAYSLYNWMVAEGYEYASNFEKALQLEKIRIEKGVFRNSTIFPIYFRNYGYYSSGLYSEQIKRYLDVFGKNKCLIILFEDMKADLDSTYSKISSFLEISKKFSFKKDIQNESKSVKLPSLQYHLRHNSKTIARKFLVPDTISKRLVGSLKNWNTIDKKPKKINEITKKMLQNKYEKDIRETGRLINRDTSIWLK